LSDSLSHVGQARANVLASIKAGAQASGADFGYLLKTAQRESSLDPHAKAGTSSATGLFQFTDTTWMNTLERYGAKHGVDVAGMSRHDVLALRSDAGLSAKMAGELANENAGILEKKLGRPATQGELYLAHFMGPHEAAKLTLAAQSNAKGSATDMFPAASAANAAVFRAADGGALDAAGLYRKLTGGGLGDLAGQAADMAVSTVAPLGGPAALLMAKAGLAQMNSALLAALFDVQGDDKR
jgi:hypothetical protein